MRTENIEETIYSYTDLFQTENVILKGKVLTKLWDININHEWYEGVYDIFITNIAPARGFDVTKIYFSGFHSQGDGAMFEGTVTDFTQFIADKRISRLVANDSICLSKRFEHSGRYYHEKSYYSSFDVECTDYYRHKNLNDYCMNLEENIDNIYEGLCKELYKMLNDEYDYLTSDEAILESIEANEYEFDELGNIY